jgi:hypothetical protein
VQKPDRFTSPGHDVREADSIPRGSPTSPPATR